MRHFPLFLDLKRRTVAVSGSGETAASKLRLLLKTQAAVRVFGASPAAPVRAWAEEGRIELISRPIRPGDAADVRLLYCANDSPAEDSRAARIGRSDGALVCIVDNLEDSDFITPAIVDRDPVTVAIGTEGTAPVLARRIKADLESRLPVDLGMLAGEARKFRRMAASLPAGRVRRQFWSRFFGHDGSAALSSGGRTAVSARLMSLFAEIRSGKPEPGRVVFAGFGDGDPGNLTLNVRRLLDEADVILHDPDVPPQILELARREAEFIPRGRILSDGVQILLDRAERGSLTGVLLRDVSPRALFLRQAVPLLRDSGAEWEILPGIRSDEAPQRTAVSGGRRTLQLKAG